MPPFFPLFGATSLGILILAVGDAKTSQVTKRLNSVLASSCYLRLAYPEVLQIERFGRKIFCSPFKGYRATIPALRDMARSNLHIPATLFLYRLAVASGQTLFSECTIS